MLYRLSCDGYERIIWMPYSRVVIILGCLYTHMHKLHILNFNTFCIFSTYIHTHIYIGIFFNVFILFIYFWLCWVLLLCAGFLQLQRAGATLRCGVRASHCGGFSCRGTRALGAWASVVVAHGLSCSAAYGIFPDQGQNLCPLHWQADS